MRVVALQVIRNALRPGVEDATDAGGGPVKVSTLTKKKDPGDFNLKKVIDSGLGLREAIHSHFVRVLVVVVLAVLRGCSTYTDIRSLGLSNNLDTRRLS